MPSSLEIPAAKQCTLYWPGHSVHWIQALHSANKPEEVAARRVGAIVDMSGEVVQVDFDGSIERYRNHDPDRLRAIVERHGRRCVVNTRYAILRVAGRWCVSIAADTGQPLARCRTDEMTEVSAASCTDRLWTHGGFSAPLSALEG